MIAANPGMAAVELDITDPASIAAVAAKLVAKHPDLNVLVNNAGIMQPDAAAGRIDDALMVDTIVTNLMGPIRMTSALVEHLKGKNDSVIAYTSSVLGFVPLAVTAVYSSTKAALHSYALSQRFMLRDTSVRVLRDRATLGEHRTHEQSGGRTGDAAQSIHRRDHRCARDRYRRDSDRCG